jgi:hypothetical protein
MERWAVAANFVGPRLFRWGAKVRVILWTGGDPSRLRVEGLNFHGRKVDAWVSIGHLRSFRPVMVRDTLGRETKAEAAAEAAGFERMRELWGVKCPLLTWQQHYKILRASRAAAN